MYWWERMSNTKIKITKKQYKELVEQFKNDQNLIPYKSQTDEYYSFLHKKGTVVITIYKFDKYYYLEISSSA